MGRGECGEWVEQGGWVGGVAVDRGKGSCTDTQAPMRPRLG